MIRLAPANLKYKKVFSLLTAVTFAIITTFVLATQLVVSNVQDNVEKGYGPYPIVIGAEGSPTQLVLNTFYHFGAPLGNVPYNY
ncbi:MAG: ABC transporter permease, partial [Bacilli bacterium]